MKNRAHIRRGSVFVTGNIGGNAEIGLLHGSTPRVTGDSGELICIERADIGDLLACLRVFAVRHAEPELIEALARECGAEVTWRE